MPNFQSEAEDNFYDGIRNTSEQEISEINYKPPFHAGGYLLSNTKQNRLLVLLTSYKNEIYDNIELSETYNSKNNRLNRYFKKAETQQTIITKEFEEYKINEPTPYWPLPDTDLKLNIIKSLIIGLKETKHQLEISKDDPLKAEQLKEFFRTSSPPMINNFPSMFSISKVKRKFYNDATGEITTYGNRVMEIGHDDLPNENVYYMNGDIKEIADQIDYKTSFHLALINVDILSLKGILWHQFDNTPNQENFLDFIEYVIVDHVAISRGKRAFITEWVNDRRESIHTKKQVAQSKKPQIKINKLLTYNWTGKPAELIELHKAMKGFLIEATVKDFCNIFESKDTTKIKPVKWLKTITDLLLFLNEMMETGLIIDERERMSYKKLQACFLKIDGSQFNEKFSSIFEQIKKGYTAQKPDIKELVKQFK